MALKPLKIHAAQNETAEVGFGWGLLLIIIAHDCSELEHMRDAVGPIRPHEVKHSSIGIIEAVG
jgi:hypothetical protein